VLAFVKIHGPAGTMAEFQELLLGLDQEHPSRNLRAASSMNAETGSRLCRGIQRDCLSFVNSHCSPPYLSGGTLTKDSKLAKVAAHYDVSGERILRELEERPTVRAAKPKGLQPAAPKPKASTRSS
jgi:hypothetical protein